MSCESIYVTSGTACPALRPEVDLPSAIPAQGWKEMPFPWMQGSRTGRYLEKKQQSASGRGILVGISHFAGCVHAAFEVTEEGQGLAAATAMRAAQCNQGGNPEKQIKGAEARGEEGGSALGCWAGSSSARRLFSVICAELMMDVKRELECYRNPEIRGKMSRCKHLKFLQ